MQWPAAAAAAAAAAATPVSWAWVRGRNAVGGPVAVTLVGKKCGGCSCGWSGAGYMCGGGGAGGCRRPKLAVLIAGKWFGGG